MIELQNLETPCLLMDVGKTRANIERMQALCDAHGVALRPHMKTHKMVEVARMQIEAGALGLTCAKISEAEAMLASGVREIFIAHSIVDPLKGPRLKRLSEELDRLVLAVTSAEQGRALDRVLQAAGIKVRIMLALDSGLDREGARSGAEVNRMVEVVEASPRMELRGLYTHEGHAYAGSADDKEAIARGALNLLLETRERLGRPLELWPGCSVTAAIMATFPGVDCVRPGAYVFGDHSHARRTLTMTNEQVSLFVVATVIDKSREGLALIDAGSKVFSGDKTPGERPISGYVPGREIEVVRTSEEHGFLAGADVDALEIGEKLAFVVAHVCPVMNLADGVVLAGDPHLEESNWAVEARGCSQ